MPRRLITLDEDERRMFSVLSLFNLASHKILWTTAMPGCFKASEEFGIVWADLHARDYIRLIDYQPVFNSDTGKLTGDWARIFMLTPRGIERRSELFAIYGHEETKR